MRPLLRAKSRLHSNHTDVGVAPMEMVFARKTWRAFFGPPLFQKKKFPQRFSACPCAEPMVLNLERPSQGPEIGVGIARHGARQTFTQKASSCDGPESGLCLRGLGKDVRWVAGVAPNTGQGATGAPTHSVAWHSLRGELVKKLKKLKELVGTSSCTQRLKG